MCLGTQLKFKDLSPIFNSSFVTRSLSFIRAILSKFNQYKWAYHCFSPIVQINDIFNLTCLESQIIFVKSLLGLHVYIFVIVGGVSKDIYQSRVTCLNKYSISIPWLIIRMYIVHHLNVYVWEPGSKLKANYLTWIFLTFSL